MVIISHVCLWINAWVGCGVDGLLVGLFVVLFGCE